MEGTDPTEVLGKRVAVVWLHGLGDCSARSSWEILKHMSTARLVQAGYDVKWIFPTAEKSAVSALGGSVIHSWFDIKEWPIKNQDNIDRDGMLRSISQIFNEINQLENQGYQSDRIVIGGFSQGGSVAMNTVYRSNKKFAGCICLSGWLQILESDLELFPNTNGEKHTNEEKLAVKEPINNEKRDFDRNNSTAAAFLAMPKFGLLDPVNNISDIPISTCNNKTTLFWGHGLYDDKVLFEHFQRSIDLLQKKYFIGAYPLISKYYTLAHTSHPDQIEDLTNFLIDAFNTAFAPPTIIFKTNPAVPMDRSVLPSHTSVSTAAVPLPFFTVPQQQTSSMTAASTTLNRSLQEREREEQSPTQVAAAAAAAAAASTQQQIQQQRQQQHQQPHIIPMEES